MTQLYVSAVTQMIVAGGLAIRMSAGVAQQLHPALVNIAMTLGVVPEGEVAPDAVDVVDRTADVVMAILAMMEEGDAKSFSERSGEPNLVPLRKQAGFQVTDAERDAAWALVKVEE
jgi:hypothetical protein